MKKLFIIFGLVGFCVGLTGAATAKTESAAHGTFTQESLENYMFSQWSQVLYGVTDHSELYLKKAMEADPVSWYLRLQMAEHDLLRGAFFNARHSLEMLSAEYPKVVDIKILLAKVYTLLSEFARAKSVYQDILRLDAYNEEALFHMALVHASEREYTKALKLLDRMAAFSDNVALVYLYKARILLELGRDQQAVDALKDAVAHHVDHAEIWLLLAILVESQGHVDEALTYYKEYSEINPGDTDVLKKMIDIYVARNDYRNALPYLYQLHSMDPDDHRVSLKLALIEVELNQLEAAQIILEHIVSRSADAEVAQYYLGMVCQMREDYACSERAYGHVGAESPYYTESLLQRAFVLIGLRKYKDAIRTLEAAKQKDVFEEDHALVYSAAYELDNRLPAAVLILDEYLKDNPHSTRALYAKASVLYKQDKYNEAIQTIRALLQADPVHAQGLNFLGYHYLTKEQSPEKAYVLLKKAIELAPNDPFILDSWGWYWVTVGEHEKGLPHLERAYMFLPHDAEILDHLVVALLDMGNVNKARQYLNMGEAYYANMTPEDRATMSRLQDMVRDYDDRLPAAE